MRRGAGFMGLIWGLYRDCMGCIRQIIEIRLEGTSNMRWSLK